MNGFFVRLAIVLAIACHAVVIAPSVPAVAISPARPVASRAVDPSERVERVPRAALVVEFSPVALAVSAARAECAGPAARVSPKEFAAFLFAVSGLAANVLPVALVAVPALLSPAELVSVAPVSVVLFLAVFRRRAVRTHLLKRPQSIS